MPNFTTEDLIQYLYHETSNEQSFEIEKALQESWELKEKFDVLTDSMQSLDKIVESPRPQSIAAILNYAKSSAEVEQH